LDDAAKRAIVPLKVLSLRGGAERIAQYTIEQFAERYDQRLAQYRAELYPQIGFQQIQDAGRDIEPPLLG